MSTKEIYLSDPIIAFIYKYANSSVIPKAPHEEYFEDIDTCSCDCCHRTYDIARVIFNAPATIVFWTDGTKTVVKCHDDDKYDKEKGLAMAYMKKFYDDSSSKLNKVLRRFCNEY